MLKETLLFLVALSIAIATLAALSMRMGSVPPLGILLDPKDGLYLTARASAHPGRATKEIDALRDTVLVLRDDRGVPHIFARHDLDAIAAVGYVTAQDRLFQMDFIRKVGAGRLSEATGPSTIETDRFLRRIGMEWGAQANVRRIASEGGVEAHMIHAYHAGVNAQISSMRKSDLPLEFRLLGYQPEPFDVVDVFRLLQFMTYDLTFRTDDPGYGTLVERLGPDEFGRLYPPHSPIPQPMIPEAGVGADYSGGVARRVSDLSMSAGAQNIAWLANLHHPAAEGFVHGKGSNAWAAGGRRTASGAALLAGDIHLSLTLPSIWYEAHVVSPSMNTYGVLIPGAPLPIVGFNDGVAWTFTNSGADQIDYYRLETDSARTAYRFGNEWLPITPVPDTVHVRGRGARIDTLHYSHLGPLLVHDDGVLAIQWVGHQESRTLEAVWRINHASDTEELEEALRHWDTPLQNVVFADVAGNFGVRLAGTMPTRNIDFWPGFQYGDHVGPAWTGRIQFEDMPRALNPPQGFVVTANQEPVGPEFPYYLGFDWREPYRAMRLNRLLSDSESHTAEEFRRFQADVHVVQIDLFRPFLDTLSDLSSRAETLRSMLVEWDGESHVDSPEALVFDEFLLALPGLVWDEPVFGPDAGLERVEDVQISARRDGRAVTATLPIPSEVTLVSMLGREPASQWFNRHGTDRIEHAGDVLRAALEFTVNALDSRYGWDSGAWRWGDHHHVIFPHITRNRRLIGLWRGPFASPGFAGTVSPAGDRLNTHGASWRMVVDFSTSPPGAWGVYPGGQSGNPFSDQYALHLDEYLAFEHFDLLRPRTPEDMAPERSTPTLLLVPARRNR